MILNNNIYGNGICYYIIEMKYAGRITKAEAKHLQINLYKNKPIKGSIRYGKFAKEGFTGDFIPYWWTRNENGWIQRILFIQHMVQKSKPFHVKVYEMLIKIF